MKQTIGNACGTIGVLHSLANNQDAISVSERTLHRIGLPTCSVEQGSQEHRESGRPAISMRKFEVLLWTS